MSQRTRGMMSRFRRMMLMSLIGHIGMYGSVLVAQERVAARNGQTEETRMIEELLARPVTVRLHNVPLKAAIDALSQTSKVVIQYKMRALDAYPAPVSIRVSEVPLGVALDRVLEGTKLRVAPDGPRRLVITDEDRIASDSTSLVGSVAGTVVDSVTGKPLARVTIKLSGTKLATISDETGKFLMSRVPTGSYVVTFKLLGYRVATRHIAVTSTEQFVIRVGLEVNATTLNEVVTTATGSQRKVEVGSDITRINVDSVMANAPISSVTDLLETRVPGLTVVRTTGTPGDPSRLRLRGAASITGNNAPIVIIDGVRVHTADGSSSFGYSADAGRSGEYPRPSPLDQLDPNSIETIEVFKGPSASALYGSDAANGVIVITTKKGRPGTTHWNVALEQGTSAIPGQYPTNNYRLGREVGRLGDEFCERYNLNCETDRVVAYQALNDARVSPLARGGSSSGSATVSGGTAGVAYSFTASAGTADGMLRLPPVVRDIYERKSGTTPPSWMIHPDRYNTQSGSGQISVNLSSDATMTVMHQLSQSVQHRSSLDLNGATALMSAYIDDLEKFPNSGAFFLIRPDQRVIARTRSGTTGATLRWQVRSWLPVNANAGLNSSDNTDRSYVPAGSVFNPGNVPGADTTGRYGALNGNTSSTTVNVSTLIPIPLPHDGRLDVAFGTNFLRDGSAISSVTTSGLPVGMEDPVFDPKLTTVSQSSLKTATFGWYVEPRVRLPGRFGQFFVTPGIRIDNNGASGRRAGVTLLPKFNLSYLAWGQDREAPGALAMWIPLLRVRAAVGVAGVQPDPVRQLRLFTVPTAVSLDGGQTTTLGIAPENMGNTKLRPERSSEIEGGIDADLLRQRLTLTATYYRKMRRDAIIDAGVAPSAGGPTSLATRSLNIGTVRNSGLELTTSARVLDGRTVQWSVDASVSQNANRVISLVRGMGALGSDGGTRVVPGYPLFGRWARPLASYADLNGDGTITGREVTLSDDYVYLGATDPDYQATVGTNLALFNSRFTVTSSFAYVHGLTQFNGSGGLMALRSAANASDASLLTQAIAVASDNDAHDGSSGSITDYYLYQRTNTLRWQALSLNYRLPDGIARWMRGSHATLALQGSNLGLKTNYSGKDPNVNAFSSGNAVADFGQLPQPRTWTLRLNLSR